MRYAVVAASRVKGPSRAEEWALDNWLRGSRGDAVSGKLCDHRSLEDPSETAVRRQLFERRCRCVARTRKTPRSSNVSGDGEDACAPSRGTDGASEKLGCPRRGGAQSRARGSRVQRRARRATSPGYRAFLPVEGSRRNRRSDGRRPIHSTRRCLCPGVAAHTREGVMGVVRLERGSEQFSRLARARMVPVPGCSPAASRGDERGAWGAERLPAWRTNGVGPARVPHRGPW